ncbi:unnamed protein product, partial [Mesorhabditis spiculigera]
MEVTMEPLEQTLTSDVVLSWIFLGIQVFLCLLAAYLYVFQEIMGTFLATIIKARLIARHQTPELREKGKELARLKKEFSEISPTGDYAKFIRKEREVNKAEEEYTAEKTRVEGKMPDKMKIDMMSKAIVNIAAFILMWLTASLTFACLPSEIFFPVSYIFAFPRIPFTAASGNCGEGILAEYAGGRYPFHHCTLSHVCKAQVQRLAENGIMYKFYRFTPEEDGRVYKNWARVARKWDLDYSRPLDYVGGRQKNEGGRSRNRAVTFGTDFWPTMCRGLICRSARQVFYRMQQLFDENGWDCEKGRLREAFSESNFTYEDDLRFLELLDAGGRNWAEMSRQLKRPQIVLWNRWNSLRGNRSRFTKFQWGKLTQRAIDDINIANEWYDCSFRKKLKKIFIGRKYNPDWARLAVQVQRPEYVVRKAWQWLCEDLQQRVAGGQDIETAYREATAAQKLPLAVRKRMGMTLMDLAQYISIAMQMLPDKCRYMPAFGRSRDGPTIAGFDRRRLAAGLPEVELRSRCSVRPFIHRVYKTIRHYYLRAVQYLWRHVTVAYLAKDVMKTMIRACIVSGHEKRLAMTTLVTEGVKYIIKKVDPSWMPPKRLRKRVTDPEVRALFSDGRKHLSKKEHMKQVARLLDQSDCSDVEEEWCQGKLPDEYRELIADGLDYAEAKAESSPAPKKRKTEASSDCD